MTPQEFIIWMDGFLSSIESVGDLTSREQLIKDKLKNVSVAPLPSKPISIPDLLDPPPTKNPYKFPQPGDDDWYPDPNWHPILPQIRD